MFNNLIYYRPRLGVTVCQSALMIGLIALWGCSGPEDPTLPISGTITLNGQPVEHGDIEFGGKQNKGLRRGAMIINGKYKTAPFQGLLPGDYNVRIFSIAVQPDEDPNSEVMPGEEDFGTQRDLIPPEYNMRSKQEVTVTAEGPNEFNFEIVTKK